jgi:hypothetical protein
MRKHRTNAGLALLLTTLAIRMAGCWPFDVEDDGDTDTGTGDVGDAGSDDPCLRYGYVSEAVVEDADDIDRLQGCSYVAGDLIIDGTALGSLAGLEGLHAVGGSLVVRDNAALASLQGLGGLVQVDGDVAIERNPLVQNLAGLSWLMDVGGSLRIRDNLDLSSVDGLFGMVRLGGSLLSITDNPALSTCDAEDLAAALEARGFTGEVEIWGNEDVGPCEDLDAGIDGGTDGGADGGSDAGGDA